MCNDPHEDIILIEPLLNHFDDVPDIIFHLLENVSAARAELIVTIIWSIWKSRNLKLWKQVESSSNVVEKATMWQTQV